MYSLDELKDLLSDLEGAHYLCLRAIQDMKYILAEIAPDPPGEGGGVGSILRGVYMGGGTIPPLNRHDNNPPETRKDLMHPEYDALSKEEMEEITRRLDLLGYMG